MGAVMGELVSVAPPFPILRESTGKFVEIGMRTTSDARLRSGSSIPYNANSLSIGSGNLFAQNRVRKTAVRERLLQFQDAHWNVKALGISRE